MNKIPDEDNTFVLMVKVINAIHEKHKNEKNVHGKIECPRCKGQVGYVIAYNGHIHARCENSCIAFMQ